MKPRPDLLAPDAPPGVQVWHLTTGPLPSCHVYMEAQIFTPDSRRFVLHESATAHGGRKDDPKHRYLLCDLANGGALSPIADELGATAPSVTPDGTTLYYFVDRTETGGGSLALKRVRLDGTQRETVRVVDAPLPGTRYRPSRLYPLSTIRSDARKLALSCFLGDGSEAGSTWGLMVFDLAEATVELILQGPSWCNVHPQYSRSTDPERRRDVLIQENHGNVTAPDGRITQLVGGAGADIHVIRDDGADFRDLPWGRDGNEFCQGHQCWRGTSDWAITSTVTRKPDEQQLIESAAVPHAGHTGLASPGGVRNDLSRSYAGPHFYHFGTDHAGRRLVSDNNLHQNGGEVWTCELGEPGRAAASGWTRLALARATGGKDVHLHPFLSPDGRTAFFNSDESGVLQAYMITGLRTPAIS